MPKLIGSAPNQVSVNGMLGDMAFQSSDAVTVASLVSTGNVAIGTSSASERLVVSGTTGAANIRLIDGGTVANTVWIGNRPFGATVAGIYTEGSSSFAIGTNSTERMRIDTNGNIGIGTTSPGGNSVNRVVKAYGSTSGSFQAQSSVTTITVGAGGAEGYVEVTGAYPLQLIVNGSERVRIASDGKVGIGATSPTALLDVNSDTVRVRTSRTPASATATGNAGDICWDANYVYVCTATNTWKRAALSTW